MSRILSCKNIIKTYRDGLDEHVVLNNLNLVIEQGERIAIQGRSGSGKTTLLNLLGAIDRANSGEIKLLNKKINSLAESQREKLRAKNIGIVLQAHHLLPEFSALENVALPLIIAGIPNKQAKEKAKKLLTKVGLADRLDYKPAKLSGGQQQRVAIARAFISEPKLVLADEPTGNLDLQTADMVFKLMLELTAKHKASLVVVTHDQAIAKQLDKIYSLSDGELSIK